MGGRHSRRKGAQYERDIANLLKKHGYSKAVRSGHRQAQIGDGSGDVSGLPGFHIECKRVKRIGRIYDWMDQADRTCQSDDVRLVVCRADQRENLVVMRLGDFLEIIKEQR